MRRWLSLLFIALLLLALPACGSAPQEESDETPVQAPIQESEP